MNRHKKVDAPPKLTKKEKTRLEYLHTRLHDWELISLDRKEKSEYKKLCARETSKAFKENLEWLIAKIPVRAY